MQLVTAPNNFLEIPVIKFNYDLHDAASVSLGMSTLMIEKGGLGLAANQVGLDAQIFVMKPVLNKQVTSINGTLTVINPILSAISEELETQVEGCLSFPNVYLKVSRPKKILVEFDTLTPDGKSVIHVGQTYEDIDARVFLHEYDHLSGVLFTDRVSKIKRQMALKKIEKNNRRK
jgi:peptide deformylase